MVDKSNTTRNNNNQDAETQHCKLTDVEIQMFRLNKKMNENLKIFEVINDTITKIPSPKCSLIKTNKKSKKEKKSNQNTKNKLQNKLFGKTNKTNKNGDEDHVSELFQNDLKFSKVRNLTNNRKLDENAGKELETHNKKNNTFIIAKPVNKKKEQKLQKSNPSSRPTSNCRSASVKSNKRTSSSSRSKSPDKKNNSKKLLKKDNNESHNEKQNRKCTFIQFVKKQANKLNQKSNPNTDGKVKSLKESKKILKKASKTSDISVYESVANCTKDFTMAEQIFGEKELLHQVVTKCDNYTEPEIFLENKEIQCEESNGNNEVQIRTENSCLEFPQENPKEDTKNESHENVKEKRCKPINIPVKTTKKIKTNHNSRPRTPRSRSPSSQRSNTEKVSSIKWAESASTCSQSQRSRDSSHLRSKSQYHSSLQVVSPMQKYPMSEELRKIKAEVSTAIAQKKTFTVVGGYNTIRRSLLNRGWVEKMRISYRSSDLVRKLNTASTLELLDTLKDKEKGWICRKVLVSRLMASHPVDFYWDFSNDHLKNNSLYYNKFPYVNRLCSGFYGYSSKSGLCATAKRARWYYISGKSYLNHPRTYNFNQKGDPHVFLEDYKHTAAMSILKWIITRSNDKVMKLLSKSGKVPLKAFEFALVECKKFIKTTKHKDIDYKFEEASDFEWHQFFEYFYSLVHVGEHFKSDDKESAESMILKSMLLLTKISNIYPYLHMDGFMNIWILKPCNGCRGIGIHLCRTLEYILTIAKNNPQRKYIIQKYIERPLLIHNTKFDIRQWFLISNTNPLTIWIYKQCYIRLSSQTFNIRKLHESIHLTNNSIQSRYENANREPSLPKCNMWTLDQFQNYLELIGHPTVFKDIIYPGMKANITCALLANKERLVRKRHAFELYGSDFMITEDFNPWLLEINCRPALYASTPVTAKLCPRVLEDVVKIIIDHERDHKKNTSNFELLYKENLTKLPKVDVSKLEIETIPLDADYFIKPEDVPLLINANKTTEDEDVKLTAIALKKEMKKTLTKLMQLIKIEKEEQINKKGSLQRISTLETALKDVENVINNENGIKCEDFEQGKILKKILDNSEMSSINDDHEDSLEGISLGSTESRSFDTPEREKAKSIVINLISELEKYKTE